MSEVEPEEIDAVYDVVDTLCVAEQFYALDCLLDRIDPHVVPADLLLAWATATLPAKSKLPSRAAFVARCTEYLGAEVMRGLA